MKRLIAGTIAGTALFATAALGAVKINNNFSFEGFLDMSANRTDYKMTSGPSATDTHMDLDTAEMDVLYNFAPVTGRLDTEYHPGSSTQVIQAYLTYPVDKSLSFNAGRFISYMGFESYKATGLYQYSYAYDLAGSTIGGGIPGYHDGVSVDYSNNGWALSGAVVNGLYGNDGSLASTGPGSEKYGWEVKATYTGTKNLTVFLGYAYDNIQAVTDDQLVNLWASYVTGPWTTAAEVNYIKTGMGKGYQWLIMGNYKMSDTSAITFRYSGESIKDYMSTSPKQDKFTISPSFALSPNLNSIWEISYEKYKDYGTSSGVSIASELTFYF